jgi:DNA-directed RNA polymerase
MNLLIQVAKKSRSNKVQRVEFPFGTLEYDTQVLRNVRFTHEQLGINLNHYYYISEANPDYKGLVARIVHYIDGWIASEMVNRSNFDIVQVFDKFYCHPNNVDRMRETYREIMLDLYDMDLLKVICEQFNVPYKEVGDLKREHIVCEYAIC